MDTNIFAIKALKGVHALIQVLGFVQSIQHLVLLLIPLKLPRLLLLNHRARSLLLRYQPQNRHPAILLLSLLLNHRARSLLLRYQPQNRHPAILLLSLLLNHRARSLLLRYQPQNRHQHRVLGLLLCLLKIQTN